MDSALKQMIAIGLICALIGGIVGGLAVSLLDDSPTSDDYAYVEITIKGPNPNAPDISKDISVFSTKAGTVDIFIKNRSVEPVCTIDVRAGYYGTSVILPSDATNENICWVWHP